LHATIKNSLVIFTYLRQRRPWRAPTCMPTGHGHIEQTTVSNEVLIKIRVTHL